MTKTMKMNSSKKGFTLLELVVVVAIMVMFLGTATYGASFALKKYRADMDLNRDNLNFENQAKEDMDSYKDQDIPGICTATPTPIATATPTPQPTATPVPVHQNNGNGNSGNVIHGDSEEATGTLSYNVWNEGIGLTVAVPNMNPNDYANCVVTIRFTFPAGSKAHIDPLHSYGNFSGGHYSNGTLTINASGNALWCMGGAYIQVSGRNLNGTTAEIVSVQVVRN